MSASELFTVRRLLVAAGPGAAAGGFLEQATRLAAFLDAEMDAVLLGHSERKRMAEAGMAFHWHAATGQFSPMEAEVLERDHRALTKRIDEHLNLVGGALGVRWTLKAADETELHGALHGADLVVAQCATRDFGGMERRVVLNAARAAARSVMLIRSMPTTGGFVVALEGEANVHRVLSPALRLLPRTQALSVLLVGAEPANLREHPDSERIKVLPQRLDRATPEALSEGLSGQRAAVLVLDADSPLGEALAEAPPPWVRALLLVRPSPEKEPEGEE